MSNLVVIANALGYTSIACWLCAQFPQVLKNMAMQSCEGLALPFLMNWLLGDITNLIGCILTDQLPFQTYLASYFCVIDVTLVWQYYHYRKLNAPVISPPQIYTHSAPPLHQSLILPSPDMSAHQPRSRSATHPATATGHPPLTAPPGRRYNRVPYTQYPSTSSTQHVSSPVNGAGSSTMDGSYAAIYEAALDVARAAERAVKRSQSRQHRQNTSEEGRGMMASFHSDMTASTAGEGSGNMSQSVGNLMGGRGRSLNRVADEFANADEVDEEVQGSLTTQEEMRQAARSQSRSLSLVRGAGGRGGRRAAGVAFMSLGLLVGWGGWNGQPPGQGGVVLANSVVSASRVIWPTRHPHPFLPLPSTSASNIVLLEHTSAPSLPPPDHDEAPSLQRVIGRISAWSCTTLYLTSRLPQIWKNFQRKSVEGLSILLFIFAFCGNLTYTISILLNPAGSTDPVEAGHYLLEALPYLLGSGGTLIFDLTIMLQSLIYGSAPPIPSTPLISTSRRRYQPGRKLRPKHIEDGHQSTERQPLLSASSHTQQRLYHPEFSRRQSGTLIPQGVLGLTPADEAEGT